MNLGLTILYFLPSDGAKMGQLASEAFYLQSEI